jgi:hypothetical protein
LWLLVGVALRSALFGVFGQELDGERDNHSVGAFLTVLVSVLLSLDTTFNEDRLTFSTVFGESFAGFTESSAAMPLCFLFPTRNRRGCYGKATVRRAAFTSFEFRIGTEVTEKKYFVDHLGLPPPEGYHMVQSLHPVRDKQ